jgi:hypothetical protein
MKLMTLIASLFVAAAANADAVIHDYDGALRGIALNNACVTAKEVKTVKPTKNCVKLVPVTYQDGDNTVTDWVCKKWEVAHLSFPRAFNRTVCTQWGQNHGEIYEGCVAYGTKADFLPNTISVRYVTSHGEYDSEVTRSFTFPTCK